jgi:branched-chain amino acid transport system substrate-binding protein
MINRQTFRWLQQYRHIAIKALCCIALCTIIFLAVGCEFLPNTDSETTLTVAVIGPFSGDLSSLGQSIRNGVVLASEEKNGSGGVLGKQIQLQLFDSACDYNTARSVALEAIRDIGASYIIGAVCGEASEGVAQVASDEGVLVINPTSVSEGLTLDNNGDVRPYVFRIPFIDSVQGVIAAALAYDRLEATTASILVADGGPYETRVADAFTQAFIEKGGEVLLRESYDRMAETYYDELADLRSADADIIYLPGYYDVVNKLSSQARIYGVNQIILGSDGWHTPELNVTYLEGSYFTTHFYANERTSVVIKWVQDYEKRYLILPDTVASLSYDAANILFTAIEETESTLPIAVAQAMEEMIFTTVSGQLSFDEMHNPIKPVIVLKIENGNIVFDSRMTADAVEE